MIREHAGSRTTFIDHLRVALTALVIFQHAAITYGALGGWYYRAAPEGTNPVLTWFAAVNQNFFMGFFFLIAGYYTPAAVDRKGPWRFMADRLLRLGLPLLVFAFLLHPLSIAIGQEGGISGTLWSWAHLIAQGEFGPGPLWFVEVLLLFSLVYALWRRVQRPVAATARALPGHLSMLVTVVLVGASAFVVRLYFPSGVTAFDMLPDFLPSYVALYVVGLVGARGNWLERIPARLMTPWLIAAMVALCVLQAAIAVTGPAGYSGGWSIKAAGYALFGPLFAWGIILGLLWSFRSYLNSPTAWSNFLGARAYTVYVIHTPVLVLVARELSFWSAPGLIKFLVVGTLGCAASVAVASLILRVPGAPRVFLTAQPFARRAKELNGRVLASQ